MLAFLSLPQATTLRVIDWTGAPAVGASVTPVYFSERGREESAAPLIAGTDGTISLAKTDRLATLIVQMPGKTLDWLDVYETGVPKEFKVAAPARVKARFVDEKGKPAAGAKVFPPSIIRRKSDREVTFLGLTPELQRRLTQTTDAEGWVEIGGLPLGAEIRLDVNDARYAHANSPVLLNKAEVTEAKPIVLVPGATVSGRVLRDGKGAPGIKVSAQSRGQGGWGETVTDAEGRYRITGLREGEYNVALDVDTIPDRTASAFEGLAIPMGATVVGKDFNLIKGSFIVGRVVDPSGKGGGNLPIGIYGPAHPQTTGWVQTAMTDAEGRFRARVPAGAQYVYIMDGVHKANARITTKDGAESAVELKIPPIVAPHKGMVVDAEGNPVMGARIDVDIARDDDEHRYEGVQAFSKADGSFELPGNLKFPLAIRVQKDALATPGGVTIESPDDLRAVLAANNLRTATGTILDAQGKPLADAEVRVFRWNSAGMGVGGSSIRTDAQGRFKAEGLWPDQELTFDAVAEGYGLTQSQMVSISGSGVTDLGSLKLPKADSFVGGRIEDENGKPVAGATIHLGNSMEKETRTDAKGQFRVQGVPKGSMSIRVSLRDQWLNRTIETGRADHVLVLKSPAGPGEVVAEPSKKVPLAVGKTAPELKVDTWLNATPTSLAKLRGQVVVIDFWAIWCGPCRQELPNVVKLAKRLKGKKATVIGLHDSSTWKKELTSFAKKNGLSYALAVDKATAEKGLGVTANAYGVAAIPTVVVVDPQGKVAYNGYDRAEAERVVDRLLAKR